MPAREIANVTLILGGVASGKSKYAESLVFATERPRRYIATAQAFDDEMQAKIDHHREQRGPDWTTVEAPLDLVSALADAKSTEIVLLDCLTVWLGNLMHAKANVTVQCAELIQALKSCKAPIVIVSNEVGLGGIASDKISRQFANHQGTLNQHIARSADAVVLVTAGLPLHIKGAI